LTFARALGGGSGFYEMVSLRAPTIAFDQPDQSGRRIWPRGVDRTTLDPYYNIAEQMLHVEQIEPHDIPKSGLVFSQMMKNLGYSCERARYAVRGCLGSGRCVTGCIYAAKQSLLLNYLPQAVSAGATVHTGIAARWVANRPSRSRGGNLPDIPYLYEVQCEDVETGRPRRYRSKIVILAGGAVGTAHLLLASRKHLQSLSAHVGQNIAFNGGVRTAGLLGEHLPDGDMYTGRSIPA
jgi:enediyne biosynthesis protein E9